MISSNFIAAHELVGSPLYVMLEIDGTDLLRFDFETPMNAVGVAVLSRADHGLIELEAYDATGLLIDEVFFLGDVIDGTILGSDYGHVHDVDYGFFGVFTPETEIAYALLRGAPHTAFDDLHFGVIPEPATGLLVILGIFAGVRANLLLTGGQL